MKISQSSWKFFVDPIILLYTLFSETPNQF
jgi:hypothetical protein